jgi:hypothetical protein
MNLLLAYQRKHYNVERTVTGSDAILRVLVYGSGVLVFVDANTALPFSLRRFCFVSQNVVVRLVVAALSISRQRSSRWCSARTVTVYRGTNSSTIHIAVLPRYPSVPLSKRITSRRPAPASAATFAACWCLLPSPPSAATHTACRCAASYDGLLFWVWWTRYGYVLCARGLHKALKQRFESSYACSKKRFAFAWVERSRSLQHAHGAYVWKIISAIFFYPYLVHGTFALFDCWSSGRCGGDASPFTGSLSLRCTRPPRPLPRYRTLLHFLRIVASRYHAHSHHRAGGVPPAVASDREPVDSICGLLQHWDWLRKRTFTSHVLALRLRCGQ